MWSVGCRRGQGKARPPLCPQEARPTLWGNRADFKGIGIIFDTHDNDGRKDNPMVTVIQGKGSPDAKWDFANDLRPQAKFRCVVPFRNTAKGTMTKVRLLYHSGALQVFINTPNMGKYELKCGNVKVDLPTGYYFGFTASTGGMTDSHNVHTFLVTAAPEIIEKEDEKVHEKRKLTTFRIG